MRDARGHGTADHESACCEHRQLGEREIHQPYGAGWALDVDDDCERIHEEHRGANADQEPTESTHGFYARSRLKES